MATGKYNGFDGAFRDAVGRKQEAEIKAGNMKLHDKCKQCGQTQGVIRYHLENYNVWQDDNAPLCMMCHMMLHCCKSATFEYRSAARAKLYLTYCLDVQINGFQQLLDQRSMQRFFKLLDTGEYKLNATA